MGRVDQLVHADERAVPSAHAPLSSSWQLPGHTPRPLLAPSLGSVSGSIDPSVTCQSVGGGGITDLVSMGDLSYH